MFSPDNDVINGELKTRLARKEIYTNIGQVWSFFAFVLLFLLGVDFREPL